MSLQSRYITEREKAAIYYHVFGGLDNWKQLYMIADPETDSKKEIKYLDTYVSKWKNSDKIKDFVKTLQEEKARQQAEQRLKGQEEEKNKAKEEIENNERTEAKPESKEVKVIDYSDPVNRKRLYNEVIANSKDDYKTKLDAAKVFEQIQKDDREAARSQKQVRYYLPLRCENCSLYLKAQKKTTK